MALEGVQVRPTASAGGDKVYSVICVLRSGSVIIVRGAVSASWTHITSVTSYIIEVSTHVDVNCYLTGALRCSAGR